MVDLLGDSLWLSLFSRSTSVLVLAFSDFFAGSSALFFSLFDSAFIDEGLDFSLTGPRVLAGALEEDGGAVIGGTGLLSGVPCGDGIGLTEAAGVAAGATDAATVGAGVAAMVVVLVLLTPTLICALKLGAGTP